MLEAQAKSIRNNSVAQLSKPLTAWSGSVLTTTTIRPSELTGKPQAVTVEKNGTEMIELDDEESDIDIDAIKAALLDAPNSPQMGSRGKQSYASLKGSKGMMQSRTETLL